MPHSCKLPADTFELSAAHPLQACWNLQLNGLAADALQAALNCALFDHLNDFTRAADLAERLSLDRHCTELILELLWSLALLERDPQHATHYRNLPVAAQHLHRGAREYCGDALAFRHRIMRQTGSQLGDYLRNGLSRIDSTPSASGLAWANAARVQIAQEQRAVTREVACALLERLPEFRQVQRLLDLGGGPGLVAIALAEALPALHGVVFEYPETAAVAADNIHQAGLQQRLSAQGGDFNADDIGSGFDLIWCSSVLHFADDLATTVGRLHAALRPGGLLVCCQAEVPRERQAAAQVLPYYLHMRLQGRHVLDEGELAVRLQQAGFCGVQQLTGLRYPVTPVNAVIARRAQG
ncbi:class I SAM-dependent methyltransferase [Pseudomonas cremoricolorata]|uniref:class I SAM-dependent methyltransferase n=1 Tax=Pseudomonas cremoricolorata TaxID=157783 RepID=UPI00040198DE|nr:class I SAM-dependent methyltransferase [Pseudomonas cremoricolorata]